MRTTIMTTARGFWMIACLGAIAWLVRPSGAEARDYPYCIKGDSYVSALGDCSFDTYAQCKASASGRLAWCDANPFYRPQADERGAYPDVRGRRFRR